MTHRFKVLRHRIPIVPRFVWTVVGRQMFETRHSAAIRSSRKVGNYGISSGLAKR